MIGALRSYIHGLLANPPACPHCGSVDVRRSHQPSRLAPLGVVLLRCRACHGLFFLRSSQLKVAEERAAEYFHAHGREKHHRGRHSVHPPAAVEPGEPIDLEALERELAAARERLKRSGD